MRLDRSTELLISSVCAQLLRSRPITAIGAGKIEARANIRTTNGAMHVQFRSSFGELPMGSQGFAEPPREAARGPALLVDASFFANRPRQALRANSLRSQAMDRSGSRNGARRLGGS